MAYRISTGLFMVLVLLGFVFCFGQGSLHQLYRYELAQDQAGQALPSLTSGQSLKLQPSPASPQGAPLLLKVVIGTDQPMPVLALKAGRETFLPVSAPQGQVHFSFRLSPRAKSLLLVNQGYSTVELKNLILQNYSLANFSFPSFAAILGAGPKFSIPRPEDWKLGLFLALLPLVIIWPFVGRLFPDGLEPPRLAILVIPASAACVLMLALWLAGCRLLLGPESFILLAWLGPVLLLLSHHKVIVWLAYWLTQPVAWFFAALLVYTLLGLDARYENQGLTAGSLPVTSDWLSNFIYWGDPFWVDHLGVNQFSASISPSLLLLSPFFYVADSQFVLITLCVAAFFTALIMLLRIAVMVLDNLDISGWARELSLAGLCLALGLNPFAKGLLLTAHFELCFILVSVALFYRLCRNTALGWLILLTVLLLGLRQDAGVYVFFLLAMVPFAPSHLLAYKKRIVIKAFLLMLLCVAYTAPALYFAGLPFDSGGGDNCWAYLGSGPIEAIAAFFRAPGLWLPQLTQSAVWELNLSAGGLQLFSAPTWLISGLPAWPLFIAQSAALRTLQGGLAAFLLPGLFISILLGIYWLGRICKKLSAAVCMILCLGLAGYNLYLEFGPPTQFAPLNAQSVPKTGPNHKNELRAWLYRHPELESLALDAKTMVYAPLKYKRYLLNDYDKADAVVFTGETESQPEAALKSQDRYRLVYRLPSLRIYTPVPTPTRWPR